MQPQVPMLSITVQMQVLQLTALPATLSMLILPITTSQVLALLRLPRMQRKAVQMEVTALS